MFVIESEADQRKRARVLKVGEIWKREQGATQQSGRSPVRGEGKNCPRKAPGGREGRSGAFKIIERGLYNWFLLSIAEGQERNCRVVGMGCNSGSVDDAVSRIPSSTGTGAIDEHLDSAIDPGLGQVEAATRTRQLV